jgi:hypothetical protein
MGAPGGRRGRHRLGAPLRAIGFVWRIGSSHGLACPSGGGKLGLFVRRAPSRPGGIGFVCTTGPHRPEAAGRNGRPATLGLFVQDPRHRSPDTPGRPRLALFVHGDTPLRAWARQIGFVWRPRQKSPSWVSTRVSGPISRVGPVEPDFCRARRGQLGLFRRTAPRPAGSVPPGAGNGLCLAQSAIRNRRIGFVSYGSSLPGHRGPRVTSDTRQRDSAAKYAKYAKGTPQSASFFAWFAYFAVTFFSCVFKSSIIDHKSSIPGPPRTRDVLLSRGRVARIVPEFCAQTTPENRATP